MVQVSLKNQYYFDSSVYAYIKCPLVFNCACLGWRNWDQFETNEVLFGVKSTFNEEIYTTKLVKGPHMKDLEMRASKLAREIEGEDTDDLHLAEVELVNLICFYTFY